MSGPNGMAGGAEAPDAARLEWLWSEYEKQMSELRAYQEEGMDIYPTAGFVLKTSLLSQPSRPSPSFPVLTPAQLKADGRIKLFVNMCSDSAIALPSMQPDGSGGEHLRVPMSAGPVSLDVEKDSTTPCLVCDVVLNPESIAQAARDKDFREFIGSFALQKLEEKYKITVDHEQVKWPKMKFKATAGNSQPAVQHIRRPKTAHVEEQREETAGTGAGAEQSVEERRKAAALSRIEALRALEERESGIQMNAHAAASPSGANIFLTEQQAQAQQEASPLDRLAHQQKEPAKIEVISSEAAPTPTPAKAAQSTKAAAIEANAVPPASTPGAASSTGGSSSLPEYAISYLKSLASEVLVAPSDWDLDLPEPPAAVRLVVQLPLAATGSEVVVDVHATGVTISSAAASSHAYQLHVSLPFVLDDAQAACKFTKKTRTMTLTLPVTSRRDLEAEEAAAAEAEACAREAAAAAVVDWRDQLALTNTIMFRPVSAD